MLGEVVGLYADKDLATMTSLTGQKLKVGGLSLQAPLWPTSSALEKSISW